MSDNYIGEIMPGCGIILYTKKYGKIKYLGLEPGLKLQKKNKGRWDLPKGIREPNETKIQCAIRETYEETGILIDPRHVSKEFLEIGKLTMFFAQTDLEPTLESNPHSGIQEHISFKWVEDIELYSNCYIWLKPFVKWVSTKNL